jgi:HEAT repeat protein
MQDEDVRVRDSAIAGLPFIDDPRARDALYETAKDAVPRARASAMRALGACRSDVRALAVLMRGLTDSDPWVRYYACQSLGRLEAESAAEAIARLVSDDAGQVRVAAVEALAYLKSSSAHDRLVAAANADDADVQRASLIGLGLRRAPEGIPILMKALAAPDTATRIVALGALAGYDQDQVTQELARAALDPDEGVRNAAIGFLAGRRGATPALIELLGRYRSLPRLHEALAHPSADRVSGLLTALGSADDETAPLLTSALARMQRPEAASALVRTLQLPHLPARKAAAMTLAGIGTREALTALRVAASSDADPEVRRICALVLA